MPAVTTDDLNRIYDKIDLHLSEQNKKLDSHASCLAEVKTDVAVIKNTMAQAPPIPTQPCTYLNEHKEDHKKMVQSWTRPAISAVVNAVAIAIMGLIGYFMGKR